MAKKVHETITSMNAKEELYGSRLTKARVARVILTYEVGVTAFGYAMYGPTNLWIIVIWMALAAFYIYRKILPMSIDANYSRKAQTERNRFINIVTQGMTTKNANIVAVLRRATDKAEGEFKLDLERLLAILVSSPDQSEKHEAFRNISKKYGNDIYFALFMEQVETVYNESQYHIETFNTFKDSHNTLLLKQKEFIRKKKQAQIQLMSILVLSLVTSVICLYSNGYQQFLTTYAENKIGILFSTLYLIALALIINGFYQHFYDDTITSY